MEFHPYMRSIFFNSLDRNSPYYQEAISLFGHKMPNKESIFNRKTKEKYNKALAILKNGISIE